MEQEKGQFPYIGKECYVYTTQTTDDTEYVKFTSQSPENLIAGLKRKERRFGLSEEVKSSIWSERRTP